MSYILEALRKSERERALGQVPSLDTVHDQARPPRSLPWAVIAIALVLLLAVVVFWLLRDTGPTASGIVEAPPPPTTTEAQLQPPALPPAPPAVDNRIAAETLPPALREQLPPLDVNVVSYSDNPAKRFIMINQRILREDERLGADITVREIMPDSARLEFRGHEFLVRP